MYEYVIFEKQYELCAFISVYVLRMIGGWPRCDLNVRQKVRNISQYFITTTFWILKMKKKKNKSQSMVIYLSIDCTHLHSSSTRMCCVGSISIHLAHRPGVLDCGENCNTILSIFSLFIQRKIIRFSPAESCGTVLTREEANHRPVSDALRNIYAPSN